MGRWHKTGCVLCAQNCGLEVLVEDGRLVRSRPDKDNPRSRGYTCRKGLNVAYHQHHADRLTQPLKKTGSGFKPVSWDQALDEIAGRLREIVDAHGPKSFAYMGGGGQGCHFEAAFGVRLMRGLGSRYHYSPLAQELTGKFWGHGRAFGRQHIMTGPDHHDTDVLLAIGWNGWMSHQMPRARRVLDRIAKDPDKMLIVIDPRNSETAKRADVHLAIRPGADALLTRAMIALILQEGWQDQAYVDAHTSGFDQIRPWFDDFDVRAAIDASGLEYDRVREVCRLLATRRSSYHEDLGVLMGRHSTLTTYLEIILFAICGRFGVRGGNVFPGRIMPLGSHSDERNPKTWRTATTGFPAIMGVFPPAVMPEEILSDHPDRLRAVLVSQSNPLRSYPDTSAYEEAFDRLDLLVTIELAMTETAARSDYVLPARSGYESWDGTFFPWTWPEVYFQMRRPVVDADGDPKEAGAIMLELADRLGLVPGGLEPLSEAAATGDRRAYGAALMDYVQKHPETMAAMPFVLGKTLGPAWGSVHLAALWGMLQTLPPTFQAQAARAGFTPGPALGEELFQAILDHPEGLWIGSCDPDRNLEESLRTENGRIDLYIPEMDVLMADLTPDREREAWVPPESYPLLLMAGRHMDYNANTLMRDPAWNKGVRACTLAMHPDDAERLNLADGASVAVVTEAGRETAVLEITPDARPGHVALPHGFGLIHQGQKHGANVNRLTKNTNRDPIAGTPLHRWVPCRVEPS